MNALCRTAGLALLSTLLELGCSAGRPPPRPVAEAPHASSASAVLPTDLDAVVWLDIARLRGLWTVHPERQIAKILAEYGMLEVHNDSEAKFWLKLLSRSERFWIGCRPTSGGCADAVLYARGRFDGRAPVGELDDLSRAIDLGAGWFRHDRRTKVARRQVARIYVALPDRVVTVSPAELDAVELKLEQGRPGSPLLVDEHGLVSLVVRASAVARHWERRAPAAARLLREAETIRLTVDNDRSDLQLTVAVRFMGREYVERARDALVLIAPKLGIGSEQLAKARAVEIVGNDLVLRMAIANPGDGTTSKAEGSAPGAN